MAGEGSAIVLRATDSTVSFPGFLAVYGSPEKTTAAEDGSDNGSGGGASASTTAEVIASLEVGSRQSSGLRMILVRPPMHWRARLTCDRPKTALLRSGST